MPCGSFRTRNIKRAKSPVHSTSYRIKAIRGLVERRMLSDGIWQNILIMALCYVYIGIVIFAAGKIRRFTISQKASRKFLHAMIGNLVFIIPLFTSSLYPVAVAAPFIVVTFLATPYSPFKILSLKVKELVAITEKGHHLGLVLYSISYTILAFFFASRPYVMAAGVLPMAYGDSVASIVGEKYGKRKYKTIADKSLEGSLAMFLVSLLSLIVSWVFFSAFYPVLVLRNVFSAVVTAGVATVAEGFSPLGLDNLTVPLFGAFIFSLVSVGF